MASAAAPASNGSWSFAHVRDLILPLGIVACVLVILIPLPPALIDTLLVGSITMSVVILLTTIHVRTPLEFSVFPSLLLGATLGRLVLNVATTRLILTQAASHGSRASGGVIETFGDFVAGGNIVVGLILFSIIVLIQFVVITKGSTRISEVAARFALDGMPGRQMAIDADLSAGVIDEKEAQRRRVEIQRQADFLATMDGASKFVRGDAVAGIAITLVNIVGGLVIGVGQAGMGPAQAGEVFTKLTIGDGLVTQIPALLIALAAALLVTRSSQKTNLPAELLNQLFSRPQALLVASGFLVLLVFTNLPRLPLTLVAASCAGLAFLLTRADRKSRPAAGETAKKNEPAADDHVMGLLSVDPLEVEIGLNLVRLADRQRGGDLLQRIQQVRHEIAGTLGMVMPKVRIRDNIRLRPNGFRIKMAGTVVLEGTAENSTELARHLTGSVQEHADELLTRDATKYLIDRLRQTHPVVVDELVPDLLSLAQVQQALRHLLRERVPIRQLAVILESLGDYASRTKDPVLLGEYVRQRLARTICAQYRNSDQVLYVIALDPEVEDHIRAGMDENEYGFTLRLAPQTIERLCDRIAESITTYRSQMLTPVLLVNPNIRAAVREMTTSRVPRLAVLSYNEIDSDTQIQCIDTLRESIAAGEMAAA
jgi:flagellar biosynthesis protein FlhA